MEKRKRKPLIQVSSLIAILIIELVILNTIFMFCIVDVYASQLQQQALERTLAEEQTGDDFVDEQEPEAEPVDATGAEESDVIEDEPEIIEEDSKNSQDESSAQHSDFKKHEVSTEFYLYDISLSDELQRYTFDISAERGLNYEMILAIMFRESTFREGAVSKTNDYGIMQINRGNHKWLSESLGITDFLDPKQSIDAGTFHLKGIADNGFDDVHKILMVYNLGGRKANDLWHQGIYSSPYSRSVVEYMESLRWMRRTQSVLPKEEEEYSGDSDEHDSNEENDEINENDGIDDNDNNTDNEE